MAAIEQDSDESDPVHDFAWHRTIGRGAVGNRSTL
jgi:hypothetical protein